MKKQYNNLTIVNLMKTDWIKQFNKEQQEEINYGIKENLEVSWYAKPEFSAQQMREILWGLQLKIDVSIYANPKYSICCFIR